MEGREKLTRVSLSTVGLFAGIGGIERGLERAGHRTELLCEIDSAAQRILRRRFPAVDLVGDVRSVRNLPKADLVAAGFPCTDLSQAGRTQGIQGKQSGLVGEVFRLLDSARRKPTWLLLENVPFMLQLDRGRAMRFLTKSLDERGYRWAYRIIEARAFGLPQRRQRVILVASQSEDPRQVLFVGETGEPVEPDHRGRACGFYWTEGLRGLGWAVDAVPTLKGGSTIGIPSPPAIWMPDGAIATPDIRDAERLQGFAADWTRPAAEASRSRKGHRWKLVGNAVSVLVARWVGNRLASSSTRDQFDEEVLEPGDPWPHAAWGENGKAVRVKLSAWPTRASYKSLTQFLRYPPVLLSARAAAGFLERARRSSLRFPDGLLDAVETHLANMRRSH